MKKGIFLSIISVIFAVITITMSKIINFNEVSPTFYIFIGTLVGGILCIIQYKRNYNTNKNSIKQIKRTSIINGLLISTGSIFFVKAMTGNLGVVYTINSFSIFISIVLTVIFYKDHLDIRKTIAIFLTILSMLFFKVF